MRSLAFVAFLASLAVACGPAVDTTSGGGEGEATSTSDTPQGTTSTTHDPSNPLPTDSVTSSTPSSSSTAEGPSSSSSSTSEPPEYNCPPNPYSNCTVAPDCDLYHCGDLDRSYLDADGCLRPRCGAEGQCPSGMHCYAPVHCGGECVELDPECSMSQGECQCYGQPQCGTWFCLPEEEWPPGCCPLDSDDPESCPPRGK